MLLCVWFSLVVFNLVAVIIFRYLTLVQSLSDFFRIFKVVHLLKVILMFMLLNLLITKSVDVGTV